jgi:hypothetical protein
MGLMDTPKGMRMLTAKGEPQARSDNRQAPERGVEKKWV